MKYVCVISLVLSGCATMVTGAYQSYSAGHVGCNSKEIEISDLDQGMYNETWTSTCHGKRYTCSRVGSIGSVVKQVSCHENFVQTKR